MTTEEKVGDAGPGQQFAPRQVTQIRAGDQVANQLRDAMVKGLLKPGDRLAELTLAEQFGVSRPTIRNAITTLRQHGMISTHRGAKGGHFIVAPQTQVVAREIGETFSLWFDAGAVTVAEIHEARLMVERDCVRLAAVRRTGEDLALLREVVDAPLTPSTTLEEVWELDVQFHHAIARAAKNRLLELPMLAIHLLRPYINRLLAHHDLPRTWAEHRAIYEAILARDPDLAERMLLAHAARVAQHLPANLLPTVE